MKRIQAVLFALVIMILLIAVSCSPPRHPVLSPEEKEKSSGEQSSSGEKDTDGAEEPSLSDRISELQEEYKDNPELFDAAVYALAENISVDEGVRRLDVMNAAGPLGAELENNEPDTFAGFWIEHKPEFRLVAAFTCNGTEILERYREKYPDLIEITDAVEMKYTLQELLRAQQQTGRLLNEMGLFFASNTDIKKNQVEIYVTDGELFYSALEKMDEGLPDCVIPVIIYEPSDELPAGLNPDSSVHFPRLKTRSGTFMLSLLIGKLELEDGYLRVNGDLIIWQPDYFVHNNDGTIEIWDSDGNVVGRVGEKVYMGGGESGSADWINEMLEEPLPPGIEGPFWIQGQDTKLYTGPASADKVETEEAEETGNLTIEELLDKLPVYSGSELSVLLESESATRISPLACRAVYISPSEPEYRVVSTQYALTTGTNTVIEWYKTNPDEMGFEKAHESEWRKDTVSGRAVSYYLPAQPSVSVEVHTYTLPDIPRLVYELVVVQDVLLSRPYNENLPPFNIDTVTIEYKGYDGKTISDFQDVLETVEIVNSLPARPDYIILGPPAIETIFTLTFHSASEGEITVTSIVGGNDTGINIEGHPVLMDVRGLLNKKLLQIVRDDSL